jgi:hypothetical protein
VPLWPKLPQLSHHSYQILHPSYFYTKPQPAGKNNRTSIEGITIPFVYTMNNHPVLVQT